MPLLKSIPRLAGNLLQTATIAGQRAIGTGLQRAGQTATRVGAGLARTGQQALQGAGRLGQTAIQAGRNTVEAAKPVARFMGNRPAEQPLGRKGLLRLMVSPNYPGLDRPVGMSRSVVKPVAPRPYDRTRQAIGHGLRWGGRAGTALAAPGVVYGGLYAGPQNALANFFVRDDPEFRSHAQANTGLAAVDNGLRLGYAATGLSSHPYDQFIGKQVRQNALPWLGNELHYSRQTRPGMHAVMDLLRSATPAGAAITAGLRQLAQQRTLKPVPPDMQESLKLLGSSPEKAIVGPALNRLIPANINKSTGSFVRNLPTDVQDILARGTRTVPRINSTHPTMVWHNADPYPLTDQDLKQRLLGAVVNVPLRRLYTRATGGATAITKPISTIEQMLGVGKPVSDRYPSLPQ